MGRFVAHRDQWVTVFREEKLIPYFRFAASRPRILLSYEYTIMGATSGAVVEGLFGETIMTPTTAVCFAAIPRLGTHQYTTFDYFQGALILLQAGSCLPGTGTHQV